MGSGPTLPHDLNLMTSAKILFPNKVTFAGAGGLGTSAGGDGETEFSPQRVPSFFLLCACGNS